MSDDEATHERGFGGGNSDFDTSSSSSSSDEGSDVEMEELVGSIEDMENMTDEQLLAQLEAQTAAKKSKSDGGKLHGRKALFAKFDEDFKNSTVSSKQKKRNLENAGDEVKATGNDDGTPVFKNRQRVMLLCSRGITERYRHLMKDLEALLPHARKDSKFDSKGNVTLLNELADLNDCNNTIYLEVRKHQDLYMWMSKTPHGPCAKFLIQNVHTMSELKMTGNCLKGSRPILSFDKTFEIEPQYRLMKELLVQMFGTPKGHRKSKPFFDHVFSFSIADGRIWFRNYQIVEKDPTTTQKTKEDPTTLVEIGPRFVMTPIRIFAGSFGGPTLYENPEFVSPNTMRAAQRRDGSDKYVQRVRAEHDRKRKAAASVRERDVLDEVDDLFRQ